MNKKNNTARTKMNKISRQKEREGEKAPEKSRKADFVKKNIMPRLPVIIMSIALILLAVGYVITSKATSEQRAEIEKLSKENQQLGTEISDLNDKLTHITSEKPESEIIANDRAEDPSIPLADNTEFIHERNNNLVYPDSYDISLIGFETIDIDKKDLIRELGDFGYEHGVVISKARFEESLNMNIEKARAFTFSINDNSSLLTCIRYENGGVSIIYGDDINKMKAENEGTDTSAETQSNGSQPTASPVPTSVPTTTPRPTPTNIPVTRQESPAAHIYNPDAMNIDSVPNGLYEAILDPAEFHDTLYEYMFRNHIYDNNVSVDPAFEKSGDYYDFIIHAVNDTVYGRYDSFMNTYSYSVNPDF